MLHGKDNKWFQHYGRDYRVLCVAANMAEANAYMESHPRAALLAELDDARCVIADKDDKGRPKLITRAEYMAAPYEQQTEAHRAYYGQFVTTAVRRLVSQAIGERVIRQSTDEHFNDIPLALWDSLQSSIMALCGSDVMRASTGGVSLSDCVCIAKQAARQIRGGQAQTRTGTHHYRSAEEAQRAYGDDYIPALREGRIALGQPFAPDGCVLKVDAEGRYWIEG